MKLPSSFDTNLVANYPRIVTGLGHPGDGTMGLDCGGNVVHTNFTGVRTNPPKRFVGSSPPSIIIVGYSYHYEWIIGSPLS